MFYDIHAEMVRLFSFAKRIPNWLRWLLLIPIFLITFFFILWLVRLLYFIESEEFVSWFIYPLSYLLAVCGSTVIAINMAPTNKVLVGTTLTVLTLIFIGMGIGLDIASYFYMDWEDYLFYFAGIMGPIINLLYIFYGVKEYERRLLEQD